MIKLARDTSAAMIQRLCSLTAAVFSTQANQARDQTNENVFLLQKSLTELSAQKEVAQIQSDLAQAQLDAVLTQLQANAAVPGAAPRSP